MTFILFYPRDPEAPTGATTTSPRRTSARCVSITEAWTFRLKPQLTAYLAILALPRLRPTEFPGCDRRKSRRTKNLRRRMAINRGAPRASPQGYTILLQFPYFWPACQVVTYLLLTPATVLNYVTFACLTPPRGGPHPTPLVTDSIRYSLRASSSFLRKLPLYASLISGILLVLARAHQSLLVVPPDKWSCAVTHSTLPPSRLPSDHEDAQEGQVNDLLKNASTCPLRQAGSKRTGGFKGYDAPTEWQVTTNGSWRGGGSAPSFETKEKK